MTAESNRPGRRVDPDPRVRKAIVAAATKVIREEGVRGLSVAQVLERAGLGTRAFYRHFDSKDQLVSAVFLDLARGETRRLRRRMAATSGPVDAVVAWIDARLDIVFSEALKSDLQRVSLEAQSQMSTAPELVKDAYGELLKPLIEQLDKGAKLGVFPGVHATADAQSIQGALWASAQRGWATTEVDRDAVRQKLVQFCLRGLGVDAASIAEIAGKSWISA